MINPAQTVRAILLALQEEDATQHDYQQALVTDEEAIEQVQKFSLSVNRDAIQLAVQKGADPRQALTAAGESSIVAVLLLGIEYGRMLERDQTRSLEALLEDFGVDDGP